MSPAEKEKTKNETARTAERGSGSTNADSLHTCDERTCDGHTCDGGFPRVVSPYYAALVDFTDPADPLRKMVVPDPRERARPPGLVEDPIDENRHSPLPGVIRRYRDRAVLLVSEVCPVNCRHCTRRHVGRGRLVALDESGVDAAVRYLADTPEIRDVILSGGDPLTLEPGRLVQIVARVRAIPSVEILRIGSRAPATEPGLVTRALAADLAALGPVYVNTQFNHPREVTQEAAAAVARFVDVGVPVANQAVLLAGVNDEPEIVEELCRAMLRIRVRPYYLFMCDLWPGLEHFRTTIDKALEIGAHLRGRLSGLGIPTIVVDLPGGHGKIPLTPDYVVERGDGATFFRAPEGQIVRYPDPSGHLT